MKIQQNPSISQERFFSTREKGKESPSFNQMLLEKQTSLSQERLQGLFNELEQHGVRLSQSRSLKDLLEYKNTIRTFLQEVVQSGLKLEEHRSYNQNGREKRLLMIKQVDKHLLELSDQVLQKQASSVDILGKLGEIKGILINLYL